jgi:hypothetical protein
LHYYHEKSGTALLIAYKYRTKKHILNKDKMKLASFKFWWKCDSHNLRPQFMHTAEWQEFLQSSRWASQQPVQCCIVKIKATNNCPPKITQIYWCLPHVINKIFLPDIERSNHLKYVTHKAIVRHLSWHSPISCVSILPFSSFFTYISNTINNH